MSKTYAIKEIYYTIQGEGAQTGRPAVFVRFSGCNLWSGREVDRHKAICQFCDTDFWGVDGENGGKYSGDKLCRVIHEVFVRGGGRSDAKIFIVCTGGEPLLQLDHALVNTLHKAGCVIAVETNGTLEPPEGIDWICMSPKANTEIVLRKGNELKIVFPQKGINPEDYTSMDFEHFYLQPMDSPQLKANTTAAVEYCRTHPHWKLSIQTHKLLGID